MTIQQQYGISFNKFTTSVGNVIPIVNQTSEIGYNSVLTFISLLDKTDSNSLINDLNSCISGQTNIDDGFFSDIVENRSIAYNYPNIRIDNLFTMPMQDMVNLLQDWIVYIG